MRVPCALSLNNSNSDLPFQQETLGLPEDAIVNEDSNFLLSGGDSLKALRLCEDIVTVVGGASPALLELILDGTFSDVLRHAERETLTLLQRESSPPSLPGGRKRHTDAPSPLAAKRVPAAEEETGSFKVISRAGDVTGMGIRNRETNPNLCADELGEAGSSTKCAAGGLSLELSWASDTGRCVDAPPVLLVQDGAGQRSQSRATVFIGSHSHRVQALDLSTGVLLWERVLGGRIEASAAVSHCGSLVAVGQHPVSERRVETSDRHRPSGVVFGFPQVATMAACIFYTPLLERRSGRSRRATP